MTKTRDLQDVLARFLAVVDPRLVGEDDTDYSQLLAKSILADKNIVKHLNEKEDVSKNITYQDDLLQDIAKGQDERRRIELFTGKLGTAIKTEDLTIALTKSFNRLQDGMPGVDIEKIVQKINDIADVNNPTSIGALQDEILRKSQQRAAGARVIPGVGIVDQLNNLSKGITHNAGGGPIDTQIESKVGEGDRVVLGPLSVDTSQNTLRASLPVAGGEQARPRPEDTLQSDSLFEAFSWVPDGYGLGTNNRLHQLNRQVDNVRYGMEPLMQPRDDQELAHPHPLDSRFSDMVPAKNLISEFTRRVRCKREELDAKVTAMSNPPDTQSEIYYKRSYSTKGLPCPDRMNFTKPVVLAKATLRRAYAEPAMSAKTHRDPVVNTLHTI